MGRESVPRLRARSATCYPVVLMTAPRSFGFYYRYYR